MAQWTTAPVSKTGIIGGSNPSAPAMNISDNVKESYPHLWHLVNDEHDGSGEIEKALAELTRLKEARQWEIVFVAYTGWLLNFYEKFINDPTSSDVKVDLDEFIHNVVEVNKNIYNKVISI